MDRPNEPARLERQPPLFACSSGSMLAAGIPIAMVLLGAVWYMLEIGNSVVLTQSVRASADQAAYETAVWHARGMNVIACLNLLIAALISAYTAFVTVMTWAHLASSFCWFDSKLCIQADADALRDKLDNANGPVQLWLDTSLKQISELERLTSTVAPRIAQFHNSGGTNGTFVTARTGFGASLVSDSQISSLLPAFSRAPRMNEGSAESSLPVEETNGINICHELEDWTKEMVPDIIAGLKRPWFKPFIDSEPILYDLTAEVQNQINKVACVRPYTIAQVWAGARQRPDVVLQAYGFAFGNPDVVARGESNLVNLTGGTVTGTVLDSFSVSQADYYPDCGGVGWGTCSVLPLFAPTWSARLTRVRTLPEIQNAALAVPIESVAATSLPASAVSILSHQAALWKRVDDFIH